MFLVEHCVPLMLWGAVAWVCGGPILFIAWGFLQGGIESAKAHPEDKGICFGLGIAGMAACVIGLPLHFGGKVSFLLGVLGCVLSCFVKG